jgi:DNA-binding response OmpR family regulator
VNRTILIIEDEVDLATSWARLLRRHRWQVETAGTREAGLAAVTGPSPPALAILDRRLPDGDGLDLLGAARQAGTPVIVTSSHDWAVTRRLAREAGAVAFLGKPCSSRDLLDLIESVLGAPPASPPPTDDRHRAG